MGVEFQDFSKDVKRSIEKALIAGLHEAAGEVQGQAVRNSPTDQGHLRNSWKYSVDESRLQAHIGSSLENAIWNEYGTGEWALEGKGRKSAWYVPVEGYSGKSRPTYNGKVVVVYGKNGAKFYKTNGKKPQRSLHNAFVQKKNTVIKLLQNKVKNIRV